MWIVSFTAPAKINEIKVNKIASSADSLAICVSSSRAEKIERNYKRDSENDSPDLILFLKTLLIAVNRYTVIARE